MEVGTRVPVISVSPYCDWGPDGREIVAKDKTFNRLEFDFSEINEVQHLVICEQCGIMNMTYDKIWLE